MTTTQQIFLDALVSSRRAAELADAREQRKIRLRMGS